MTKPAMTQPQSPSAGQVPSLPVMKVTAYDRVSSFLLSLVAALLLGVLAIASIWYVRRVPPPGELVPLELLEVSGGFEDGNPDDTWNVESPDPEDPMASLDEQETEQVSIENVLENVVELSDQSTEHVEQVLADATANTGKLGSASGTGGRPLGMGPGTGGMPNEQRWFVRFGDDSSLDEYARQLDFFGIELGVLQDSGQLIYVSGLSGTPKKRTAASGKDEQRLYMTWQSGERRAADIKLLARAGVTANRQSLIFHFYPRNVEQMLATLEFNYQKRSPQDIRRTYFLARKQGEGYAFEVTRQSLIR